MMRFATFSIIGTFVAAIFVMAMWPGEARFGAPSASIAQDDPFGSANPIRDSKPKPEESADKTPQTIVQWEKKIRDCLQQPWSPDYEETSFFEIMNELSQEFGFNVIVDGSAKEDALTPDTPVTFKVANLPMANGLSMMLREHNATYVVKDGVLKVISLDVASDPENFIREIIDCREVLRLIAANEKHRVGGPISVVRVENVQGGGEAIGGGGLFGNGQKRERGKGGGVFSIVSAQDDEELNSKVKNLAKAQNEAAIAGVPEGANVEAPKVPNYYVVQTMKADSILIDLIKMAIDPDGWDDTNGDGAMDVVGGCMVVVQTQEAVDQIHSLIEELTEKLGSR